MRQQTGTAVCLASEKIDSYPVKLCVVTWSITAWGIGDFSLFKRGEKGNLKDVYLKCH